MKVPGLGYAAALLALALSAVQPSATAGRDLSVRTSVDSSMAPAVDYLVAEYGLDPAVAAEQVEFSAEMEEAVPEIAETFGDSYAGAWLDNAVPGTLFVASTQPSDSAARMLHSLGVETTIIHVDHNQVELVDGSHRLSALLTEATEDDSGFHIAVDIQENELDLELARHYPITPALQEAIGSFVPHVDVQPIEAWEPDTEEVCLERDYCIPNLRGGITLQGADSPNDFCTLGYTMQKDGLRYTSTAGHCSGSPWLHAGGTIGGTIKTMNRGALDGKIINIGDREYWNAKAWVFRPSNSAVEVHSKIHEPSESLEGVTLCISGRHGQKCGELVDWSYNPDGGDWGFGKTNFDACPGDSGGPVFNKFTNRAYGMHVAGTEGCDGDGWSRFMWLKPFESWSGYTVAYAP